MTNKKKQNNTQTEPPAPGPSSSYYYPPREDNEARERPPAELPRLDESDVSAGEERGKEKLFVVTPPQERKKVVNSQGWASGWGGRKSAKAVALIGPGTGKLSINGRDLDVYFENYMSREQVLEPLLVAELLTQVDVRIKVQGGGTFSQAGAVRGALGRAIVRFDPDRRWALKLAGCLFRDSRIVERKKTGKPKARRSKQWSKR